jgi:hypothetical protein
MGKKNLEKALKDELQRLDRNLQKAEALRSAGWIGSVVGAGLVLATRADHIPVIIAIAIGATMLNIMAARLISKRK